ncbi:phosphoglycerate mutase-like protein [Xylariaceae sp. FL0804]|nr:phosphoglycerate mutase-like protein [Xylariaceae sp. FL0804]
MSEEEIHHRYRHSAVPGYFDHDAEPTGPGFRALKAGLGLVDRRYETDAEFDPERKKTQWERFVYFLESKNREGRGRVKYKLLFLSRHGEGFHNVKEAEVGRQAWEDHWSRLDGDGTTVWADALLTERGRRQARGVRAFWRDAVARGELPTPRVCYVSPLARCLETARITYAWLAAASSSSPSSSPSSSSSSSSLSSSSFSALPSLPPPPPPPPPLRFVVKERLRERFGVHTCDRRRPYAWIAENYPGWALDDDDGGGGGGDKTGREHQGQDDTGEDALWRADVRETGAQIRRRVTLLLDDLFDDDKGDDDDDDSGAPHRKTLVAVVAHSGLIRALYAATGHRDVWVAAGAMVPLLLRAERV